MSTPPSFDRYDKMPYPGVAYPFACPDRMGIFGRLHGLASPAPECATVLEIGPGDGSNLIAIASRFPGATCIGLDASASALDVARRRKHVLGLDNLTLIEGPLESFAHHGPLPICDYIIAHGVVSWVAPPVRDALMRLVGRLLAPSGVAMLSFLTDPGQHDLGPLVDLMRHHVATVPDLSKKVDQARDIAIWQLERTRRLHGEGRARLLEEIVSEFLDMPDAVLLHDILSPQRHPLTITTFAQSCSQHGLQWLTNARMNEPRTTLLPENLREFVRATPDTVKRQHYLDSFLMTRFRTSLVCRAEARVTRSVEASAFAHFHFASRFDRNQRSHLPPGVVETGVGRLSVSRESADVLELLADFHPAAVPFEALLGTVTDEDGLCQAVAELWLADAIELSMSPPKVATGHGNHPRTGALQRLIASEGRASATSLWHREHPLDDVERATLLACDGTTPQGALSEKALESLLRRGFILPD